MIVGQLVLVELYQFYRCHGVGEMNEEAYNMVVGERNITGLELKEAYEHAAMYLEIILMSLTR